MAKQRKGAPKRSGQPKNSPAGKPAESMDRRVVLRRVRNGALLLVVGGAGSWAIGSAVQAEIREADLSRIGNGIPTVVQIHDPHCPMCRALQKQARNALEHFDDSELQYLVANIRQDKGKQLAKQHGVNHVTLLLFDRKGRRRSILAGPNTSDNLKQAFSRLVNASQ